MLMARLPGVRSSSSTRARHPVQVRGRLRLEVETGAPSTQQKRTDAAQQASQTADLTSSEVPRGGPARLCIVCLPFSTRSHRAPRVATPLAFHRPASFDGRPRRPTLAPPERRTWPSLHRRRPLTRPASIGSRTTPADDTARSYPCLAVSPVRSRQRFPAHCQNGLRRSTSSSSVLGSAPPASGTRA